MLLLLSTKENMRPTVLSYTSLITSYMGLLKYCWWLGKTKANILPSQHAMFEFSNARCAWSDLQNRRWHADSFGSSYNMQMLRAMQSAVFCPRQQCTSLQQGRIRTCLLHVCKSAESGMVRSRTYRLTKTESSAMRQKKKGACGTSSHIRPKSRAMRRAPSLQMPALSANRCN